MKMFSRFLSLSIAALIGWGSLIAGNTGKIVGKVTDKQTGEPLVAVNILVVGTTRGAITDIEGKYIIIGIPIGSYTVRASLIGYVQTDISDVKIGADETTSLNFKLTSTAVELQGVTITADQQLVNSLTTSSTQTVSAKSIESIPNVKSVEDVLKLQAGVVKQGSNIFLRGGRANEVQYLVDGVPTNNILENTGDLLATSQLNEQLSQLYAGVQSGTVGGGTSGLAVSANAIQSVSVQTSGFDADYGNAQSGIVNIVTKSGGEKYTGSLQYRTDRISPSNQKETYSSFTFGGPEPLSKYLLPGLGVNIPGSLTFFFSTDISRRDGPYNYIENEFYNPIERRVELQGFLGGLLNGLGFRYRDNQKNSFTFNSKLKYDMSSTDQFSFGYRASLSSKHDYNRDWKYRADSSSLGASLSIQNIFSWTHFFGGNSFIKLYLGKVENRDGNDVAGIKPPDYSSAYRLQDPNDDGFSDLGTGQRWYNSTTTQWSVRFDLNSQVHPLHLFKTGVEFTYEEINSTEIHYPTVSLTDSAGNPISPPFPDYLERNRGEYPGYGNYRWHNNNFPNRGGFYAQDNIEFSGLNLHIGIRYDYLDLGKQIFYQDFIDAWRDQTKLEPEWAERDSDGDFVRAKSGNTFWYYFTHGNFSPRLSIGYPVTDRIVFYFNYGHFLQFPERDKYYRDPFIPGAKDNWVGSPDLKPQRTVAYEAGFEDQFTDEMAFAVRAFYKDIFDYPSLVRRGSADNNVYRNLDYASSRGFDLTLSRAPVDNFSLSVTYSYQIAKGRSSNTLAAIFEPQFQLPRETRLDWDQNHTANVFATYRVGPREEGNFFGLPFVNNYGISLTWSFGSGVPFTPYRGRETVRNAYLKNNETAPYTSTVNLSFYKGFPLTEGINLSATFDITNLFNRRNVIAGNIFTFTQRPPEYGDYDPDTKEIYNWADTEKRIDPILFDAPRQIILGLKLNWD